MATGPGHSKSTHLRRIGDLLGGLGLSVAAGPKLALLDTGEIQQTYVFAHARQKVIFWPCAESEIPRNGLQPIIERFRRSSIESSHPRGEAYSGEQNDNTRLLLIRAGEGIYSIDRRSAKQGKPRVYLWDDNALAYYEDLVSKIGSLAKNSLLAELDLHPGRSERVRVPAFRIHSRKFSHQGAVEAYTFALDPRVLLEISYVARREIRGESFYQRLLKKDKIQAIGRFIDEGNIIPNNIILAFGESASQQVRFTGLAGVPAVLASHDTTLGVLDFPRDFRTFWIIDGQHRLFGFSKANSQAEVIVTAFRNLPVPEQAKMFVDINKNQTPVRADLVWDLEGELTPELERGVISRIVKTLGELPPLSGKIYVPSRGMKKPGQLTLAGLCTAVDKVRLARKETRSGTRNPWYDDDVAKRVFSVSSGVADFFKQFREELPDEWFGGREKGLATLDGGMAVLVRLLERFIGRITLDHPTSPAPDAYDRFIVALKKVLADDFQTEIERKDLRSRLSSEGGREEVSNEFCLKIREVLNDGRFCPDLVTEWESQFKTLEQKLKDLAARRMSDRYGESWYSDRVDETTKLQVEKYMETDPESAFRLPSNYLNIRLCIQLIRKEFGLFEADFLIPMGAIAGFHSRQELESAFNHVTRMRNRFLVHSTPERVRREDERQLEVYLDQLEKLV